MSQIAAVWLGAACIFVPVVCWYLWQGWKIEREIEQRKRDAFKALEKAMPAMEAAHDRIREHNARS